MRSTIALGRLASGCQVIRETLASLPEQTRNIALLGLLVRAADGGYFQARIEVYDPSEEDDIVDIPQRPLESYERALESYERALESYEPAGRESTWDAIHLQHIATDSAAPTRVRESALELMKQREWIDTRTAVMVIIDERAELSLRRKSLQYLIDMPDEDGVLGRLLSRLIVDGNVPQPLQTDAVKAITQLRVVDARDALLYAIGERMRSDLQSGVELQTLLEALFVVSQEWELLRSKLIAAMAPRTPPMTKRRRSSKGSTGEDMDLYVRFHAAGLSRAQVMQVTEVERPAFVPSFLRRLGIEGEAGLGEECLDEGGPVLDALEPVLHDRGELVHVAGGEVAQAVLHGRPGALGRIQLRGVGGQPHLGQPVRMSLMKAALPR